MPQRDLVWTSGALEQLGEILKRRKDKQGSIRKCIETHLLAAANDLETAATKWGGPLEDLWFYRFQCEDRKDGKVVKLFLQAELEPTNGSVGVLSCGTIAL